MKPFVSFVIPVKDDATRLARCIASIQTNDYPRKLIEIIVVDNNSTDGSARVAREHGAVLLQASTRSVAALRNRGARAALGGIIAFADSDHEIDGQWVATAVEVLSSPAVAATGSTYHTAPSANWVQQHFDGQRSRPNGREEVQWLASGNFAIKRAAFDQIGGFNSSLTACEDVDLCNRLRLAGHRIVADPQLRSVHFGDPSTLRALFFGELWRGRDNLRVTASGPLTLREIRSALVPIADLLVIVAGSIALLAGHPGLTLLCCSAALIPALARAAFMMRNRIGRRFSVSTIVNALQAMAVAVVFDLARAFALLSFGSHRARRSA